MIFRVLLIYSSDFNVRTDRARICFNMPSERGRKNNVEKSESSTRNKNG